MADLKISALPAASVALAGTEVLPIVQSSATKQVTVANLTAGRAVATGALTVTGNATLSTGNLVIGTSGKGVDFSATPGTGTSELLDDYEVGTWSPVGVNFTTVGTEAFAGFYVKVGKLVFINATFKAATSTASTANSTYFTGLPFTPATSSTITAVGNSAITSYGVGLIDPSAAMYTPTWTSGANQTISVAGVYRVA